jgi:ankyrin repeat protein
VYKILKDKGGWTALMYAVQWGRSVMIQQLIEKGALVYKIYIER